MNLSPADMDQLTGSAHNAVQGIDPMKAIEFAHGQLEDLEDIEMFLGDCITLGVNDLEADWPEFIEWLKA